MMTEHEAFLEQEPEHRWHGVWSDFARILFWLSFTAETDEDHDEPDWPWEVESATREARRFEERFRAVGLGPVKRGWEQVAFRFANLAPGNDAGTRIGAAQ